MDKDNGEKKDEDNGKKKDKMTLNKLVYSINIEQSVKWTAMLTKYAKYFEGESALSDFFIFRGAPKNKFQFDCGCDFRRFQRRRKNKAGF